ncbi:nucleotide-binding domain-containing protein [Sistotremastrum niveocremeum HHB9708]|uniref:Nucleotide-binding domain-containing protein n=2 Tax=Sistotremastraceae TaxID=3402574 RepID=A0A164P5D3_9AGAM|nr:nucleotide-binding domain-containing protein [Sistotremastrum niveocremeum HHB9708]KZT39705.1 nucleotide-binding domain-containing protein [Sistotremastrum suecicum HHB10207 ss-3]
MSYINHYDAGGRTRRKWTKIHHRVFVLLSSFTSATPMLRRRPPCRLIRTSPWAPSSAAKSTLRPGIGFQQLRLESTSGKIVRRSITAAKYGGFICLSAAMGVLVIGSGIFLHDWFTYTDRHIDRVPVSPLALHPENGGPKKLPIARVLVDDEETEENKKLAQKPRLVIVGGGWGAVGLIQTLHSNDYHVTVVSPETFTTFTPLLPSAAVGTVQVRSLMESLRKVIARVHGHLITGKAVDLVMSERLLEVETFEGNAPPKRIYVPYDKLIIACGSVSSTHGVPGLEHCFQLKTISDAQAIRRRVVDNFETASLPTTSPEDRKRLLSFVVCGGGPTGVETAAEIYDLCQEDIISYYPKLCREEVSIHVVQSREHILNTYAQAISKYAEAKFQRDGVDLIVNARVKAVEPDSVIYTVKDENGNYIEKTIPSNFVLWSTGIAMNPFTSRVSDLLPNQVHKKAIEVDAHLRVKGAPLGTVYAIGDCSTIETSIVSYLLELVDEADTNHDGKIDLDEWSHMVKSIKKKFPLADKHFEKMRDLFDAYDKDKDQSLTLNELAEMMQQLSSQMTALPATAQVASQQGKYLGKKLSKLARARDVLIKNEIPETDEAVAEPFRYFHMGSLAYIGNAAVFDLGNISFMGGLMAMYAWRSVYWSEQVSSRTRALLMFDWIIRGIWGRDLSRI